MNFTLIVIITNKWLGVCWAVAGTRNYFKIAALSFRMSPGADTLTPS